MKCPKCGKVIDPAQHAELVFDGQVWCSECRQYEPELVSPRSFAELEKWAEKICIAFGCEPVWLRQDLAAFAHLEVYWKESTVLLGEADHEQRCILLYPPGFRLSSLCHELAHIFTGQDHTEDWARTFAKLMAWVKGQL